MLKFFKEEPIGQSGYKELKGETVTTASSETDSRATNMAEHTGPTAWRQMGPNGCTTNDRMSDPMVREINGPPGPPSIGSSSSSRSVTTQATRGESAAASPQPAGNAAAEGEAVHLSGSAQALQAVEQKLRALPEVNAERVAAIQAALASGQYQVDDLVVADKLLAFEAWLD